MTTKSNHQAPRQSSSKDRSEQDLKDDHRQNSNDVDEASKESFPASDAPALNQTTPSKPRPSDSESTSKRSKQ